MSAPIVTMKTIALHAGVTQATVSMSLSNHPRIPVATRERIRAIADHLGYRPDPYISTLMRMRRQGRPVQHRPVLALVCGQRTEDGWRNHSSATIRQMYEGAKERANDRGFRTQEFWLHRDGMSNDRFSEMLHARGIQGLLLGPLAEGDVTPNLRWDYFATVGLSVPLPNLTLTTVCNDHYFSSVQVIRECHARGYRRPALILKKVHRHRFQGRWEAGVAMAIRMLPDMRSLPPFYVEEGDDPVLFVEWVKRRRPDAIITPSLDTVPDMFGAIERAGRRIPQDLGFALLSCPELEVAVSGIYQNGRLIGGKAIDTLLALLERHECGLSTPATTLMIEGQWNEGRTLPHRKASVSLEVPSEPAEILIH